MVDQPLYLAVIAMCLIGTVIATRVATALEILGKAVDDHEKRIREVETVPEWQRIEEPEEDWESE
jgi:hypothetical protein